MMTREEAKEIFLNRGYIKVEGGTIYDANKWREACSVISKWLEQEPCEDKDIIALPSVTPAIIHCKECKFYKTEFCKMDMHHKDMTIYVAKPDDYCSYAEREGKSERD